MFLLQHHCQLIKACLTRYNTSCTSGKMVHLWALVTLMMNSKWCYHSLHSKGTNYDQIRLKGIIRVSFVKVVGGKNLDLNVMIITETVTLFCISVWSSDLYAISNTISILYRLPPGRCISCYLRTLVVLAPLKRASGWPACQSHSICCVLNFWLACCCKWRMYLWGWLQSSWASYERGELICSPLKIHFTHFR